MQNPAWRQTTFKNMEKFNTYITFALFLSLQRFLQKLTYAKKRENRENSQRKRDVRIGKKEIVERGWRKVLVVD